MNAVTDLYLFIYLFIDLFIPFLYPGYAQTVRNWFPLGPCIHYKLFNNVKGTHRPKTHNEKYIGEAYDEH